MANEKELLPGGKRQKALDSVLLFITKNNINESTGDQIFFHLQ